MEDVGAHIRAPEPATLYRMHGNLTGAYDIRNVSVRNRVVMTNKTPTGLNRGFGGPQVYYALERLMQRVAVELELDPLDVIRRNLVPAARFRSAPRPGAARFRRLSGLRGEGGRGGRARRAARAAEAARAEGRLYGIGLTAVVEPSVSNMGYITTVLTPEERRKAGPKNGAQATATIALDPGGAVSVHVVVGAARAGASHRGVADRRRRARAEARRHPRRHRHGYRARRVVDRLGQLRQPLRPAVCGAVQIAAERMKEKLARAAAAQLNVPADEVEFAAGRVRARGNPDNALPFGRLAAAAHWAPGTLAEDDQALRETVFWTPPQLTPPTEDDRINSSLCHGFIFDFCGLEVDRVTGAVRIDKYVTMHDCGRVLHPGMVAGQVTGGFAQAVGAALFEEYAYADDGSFISGTLADYLMPTATEVPAPLILHFETPSPFTPLGSKGVGEGNCMSTPVCIANAVADALGVTEIDLPLTPAKVAALTPEAA